MDWGKGCMARGMREMVLGKSCIAQGTSEIVLEMNF